MKRKSMRAEAAEGRNLGLVLGSQDLTEMLMTLVNKLKD